MSSTELNKGRLIPLGKNELEYIAVKNEVTVEEMKENGLFEYGLTQIKDTIYRVEFEVDGAESYSDLCDLRENEDGSVDFLTVHYNGGGSFDEVIENGWEDRKLPDTKE